jgi:hypothetical protein
LQEVLPIHNSSNRLNYLRACCSICDVSLWQSSCILSLLQSIKFVYVLFYSFLLDAFYLSVFDTHYMRIYCLHILVRTCFKTASSYRFCFTSLDISTAPLIVLLISLLVSRRNNVNSATCNLFSRRYWLHRYNDLKWS